jgi:hypothetical protein
VRAYKQRALRGRGWRHRAAAPLLLLHPSRQHRTGAACGAAARLRAAVALPCRCARCGGRGRREAAAAAAAAAQPRVAHRIVDHCDE